MFFLFSYKSVSKFWKIDNISSASFHYIYKSEENLKILKEILRQKLIVSNVILTIWNLKFTSSSNKGDRHRAPLFQNLLIHPWVRFTFFRFWPASFVRKIYLVFDVTWLISQQFTPWDLKPVVFFVVDNLSTMKFMTNMTHYRSSHTQVFFKIGVLKIFAIFTEKNLRWSLFLIKAVNSIKKRLFLGIMQNF